MNEGFKVAVTALTLGSVLASGQVMAGENIAGARTAGEAGQQQTLEHGIGVSSGAIVGALAGGPVGMMIGAGLGVWLGSRVHEARQLEGTEATLETTRASLAARESRIEQLSARNASMHEALASRESELARFSAVAERAAKTNAELRDALASGLEMQVMFRTGASELTEESQAQLERLAGVLASIDGLNVRLDGYADPRGEAAYNEALAAERVASVQQALVRGGLAGGQLTGFAHGETAYGAAEGDLDAYALARRVDISLVAHEAAAMAVEEDVAVVAVPDGR